MLQLVRDIKPHVPGILNICCGRNRHRNNKGYTHCVTVLGESSETILSYRKHSLHEAIAAEYRVIVEDSVACDMWDEVDSRIIARATD